MNLGSAARKLIWKARKAIATPAERAQLFREEGVRIGPGTVVYRDVEFGSEPYLVSIGAGCQITDGCRFVTHGGMFVYRNRPGLANADYFKPVSVGNNVYVGLRSILLPGARVGDNVLIGAGSVVSGEIPPGVVAAGVPCRPIRTLDEWLERIRDDVVFTRGMPAERKREFLEGRHQLPERATDAGSLAAVVHRCA